MALMTPQEPARRPGGGLTPFALGFRPFFLAAAIAAALLVGAWAVLYPRGRMASTYYGSITWHSHEMLFGFAAAVMAGFLLTAARNWTGRQTAHGPLLAALVGLWLAGRLLPLAPALAPALPAGIIAAVDLAFLPAVAAALAWPLVHARHWKSLTFVAILLWLALANGLVHWGLHDGPAHATVTGTYLAADMVVLLVVVMGGRVIPFFTERGIGGGMQSRRWGWVEAAAPVVVVLLAALRAVDVAPAAVTAAALLAALVHGLRLAGWYAAGIWRVPLLWVLHTAYGWLVVGFALDALGGLGVVAPNVVVHAYMAGGLGLAAIGMMSRVALGHTGRPLQTPRAMPLAFVLVNLGAALRVFGPLLLPDAHAVVITGAGLLWAAAFALFAMAYAPILLRPRVDGMTG